VEILVPICASYATLSGEEEKMKNKNKKQTKHSVHFVAQRSGGHNKRSPSRYLKSIFGAYSLLTFYWLHSVTPGLVSYRPVSCSLCLLSFPYLERHQNYFNTR
jgi:hypothetical protein